MESDAAPRPQGRERILYVISQDIVLATPAHQEKLRSLAYKTDAARFKVRQCGPATADDVSSYITQAMIEVQRKGGSTVKYLGS